MKLLGLVVVLYRLEFSNEIKCGTNRADRYEVVGTPMSWPNARQLCQTFWNSDLVVLETDEERDYVRNHVSVIGDGYWIGLNDLETEGKYRWLNGDEEHYPGWLWQPDEPTNDNSILQEDCGAFTKGSLLVHGVHDKNCLEVLKALCEDDNDPCTAEQYYTAESCDISNRYHEYMGVLNIGYNWGDAKRYCSDDGFVLASLSTEAEVRYVRQMLLNSGYQYWIGLNDKYDEAVWKWYNHPEFGEELDDLEPHRWNPEEPNGNTIENCGEFRIDEQTGIRGLNDEDCASLRPFICEIKYCKEENVIVDNNQRLLNHDIHSIEIDRLSRCIKACFRDASCRSVNLLQIQNGYLCELNNSTRIDAIPSNYVHHDGSVYAGFD